MNSEKILPGDTHGSKAAHIVSRDDHIRWTPQTPPMMMIWDLGRRSCLAIGETPPNSASDDSVVTRRWSGPKAWLYCTSHRWIMLWLVKHSHATVGDWSDEWRQDHDERWRRACTSGTLQSTPVIQAVTQCITRRRLRDLDSSGGFHGNVPRRRGRPYQAPGTWVCCSLIAPKSASIYLVTAQMPWDKTNTGRLLRASGSEVSWAMMMMVLHVSTGSITQGLWYSSDKCISKRCVRERGQVCRRGRHRIRSRRWEIGQRAAASQSRYKWRV